MDPLYRQAVDRDVVRPVRALEQDPNVLAVVEEPSDEVTRYFMGKATLLARRGFYRNPGSVSTVVRSAGASRRTCFAATISPC